MRSDGLLMWWLRKQQESDYIDHERPVLYAPCPEPVPPMETMETLDEEEPRRVIVIEL